MEFERTVAQPTEKDLRKYFAKAARRKKDEAEEIKKLKQRIKELERELAENILVGEPKK